MHRTLKYMLVAATMSLPLQVSAQGDIATTAGLTTTPIGSLAPLVPGIQHTMGKTSFGWLQRMSWVDGIKTIGQGVVVQRGVVRTSFEFGIRATDGWKKRGAPMGGVDVHVPLVERIPHKSLAFAIGLNPAVGFGRSNVKGDFSSAALGVSVPMRLSVDVGDSTLIVPFVSPGVGLTRINRNAGDSRNENVGMVAFGMTMSAVEAPVHLTVSMQRFLARDAPSVMGLSLSMGRRAR